MANIVKKVLVKFLIVSKLLWQKTLYKFNLSDIHAEFFD